MPLVHVTVPEGSLSDARKQLMVEKITAATLEAEGLPDNDRTRMLTWVIMPRLTRVQSRSRGRGEQPTPCRLST